MQRIVVNKYLFGFSLVSTAAVLFNMVLLPVFKSDILNKTASITIIQFILLFCFLTVFIFNASCLFWGCRRDKIQRESMMCTFITLVSVLTIIMIFGHETVIDELSHAYQVHRNQGNYLIILYVFFPFQLLFNTLVTIKLKR